ncbi:DgyrCDS12403 [Dimorphilus gyrociliatus]|uniref:DgyrCDS12403 n=1 Tax=Dimorphilus gyrociliatus TaxID=2664684 RepID=A0A7I8W6C6_9ANNE|nr:DgyrCDS12403 [Dimorphilus gyrociliatus]
MADFSRKDLHLTSTGVGHRYQPGYYFPSSNFKGVLKDKLPPELACPDEIKGERFGTTTGTFHDNKFAGIEYGNDHPTYKKAPALYKVHYNRNVIEKLGHGGHRRPLTMGNEESEMKAKYKANKPDAVYLYDRYPAPNPQGILFGDHQKEGPTKLGEQNTKNPKMAGRPFKVNDLSIMELNNPYTTTNMKEHRRWTPKELHNVGKKDVATYWECEEYPKAWGFGLKHNPLPKHAVPRERPPMRDTMVFKTATKVGRIPNRMIPVPHSGTKTEYCERYEIPSDSKCKQAEYCPVDTPYILPDPSSRTAFTAPGMYKTEYENIGCEQIITV